MTAISVPGHSDRRFPPGDRGFHLSMRPASWRAYGFTLIEIMVVLVIIGLVVGLVSGVARPNGRDLLQLETDRLAQLLTLAATESRLTGKRVAWTADGATYRFWRFATDTDWTEIRDVDVLRPRTLPEGMMIAAVRIENGPPLEHMRVEFSSSGAPLAFMVDLSYGVDLASLTGSPLGDVRATRQTTGPKTGGPPKGG